MAVSKRKRASLGGNVLPIPYSFWNDEADLSFEEYKELTGVDLNDLIQTYFDEDSSEYVVALKHTGKPLFLDLDEEIEPKIIVKTFMVSPNMCKSSPDATLNNAELMLTVKDSQGNGTFYIFIYHNKISIAIE